MKPIQITMQVVHNRGNYETCRLEATYTLEEGETTEAAFVAARIELDNAYNRAYPKETDTHGKISVDVNKKPMLTIDSKDLQNIETRLKKGTMELSDIEERYEIDREVMDYFKKQNLI